MKLILKVCGCLIFALMNVVAHIYDLFDATFLIRNATLDFIIVPMRKYYPLAMVYLWCCLGECTKAKHKIKRNEKFTK